MINKTQEVDKLEAKASKMKPGPEKEHQLRAVEYRNIQLQAIFVVDTMLMTYIGKISVQLADLYSTAKSSAQQLAVISRAQKELENLREEVDKAAEHEARAVDLQAQLDSAKRQIAEASSAADTRLATKETQWKKQCKTLEGAVM